MSGGRPTHHVWKCYEHCTEATGPKAICRGCDLKMGAVVHRMVKHADLCKSLTEKGLWTKPPAVSLKRVADSDPDADSATNTAKSPKVASPSLSPTTLGKPVQQTLVGCVRTGKAEVDQLNRQLCKCVVATNIPFAVVDHPEFIKLCSMLRPGCKLASAELVAGKLLDQLFSETVDTVKAQVSGDMASLLIDGWSNLRNDPVLGVSVALPGRSYLVSTVDTTGNPHTGEYLQEVVEEHIEYVSSLLGVKVVAVATDNASNMEKMRELLDDSLFTFGCQAHILNLLAKDIIQNFTATKDRVVSVLKSFRNVHALAASLKGANLGHPPLPCETRWTSLRDSLEYFCKNWAKLVELGDEYGDADLRKSVSDTNTRENAHTLLSRIDPVVHALNRMQKDEVTIAKGVEIWLDLVSEFPTCGQTSLVKGRAACALECPFFLAANCLDPRFLGKRLSPARVSLARKFMALISDAHSAQFTDFLAQRSPFSKELFECPGAPLSWWQLGARSGFPGELCDMACRLMVCMATSASLERCFSTVRITYGMLRTRLGVEKAGKLAFLYRWLNNRR